MKKNYLLLILSTSFFSIGASAASIGSVSQLSNWTWVSTFSAGPAWQGSGKTQTFFLTPDIEKTYTANKATHALFDGEFFIGMQNSLSQSMQGQLGLAIAATSNASFSGMIWDDADPQFDNYTYDYKIQHSHVALKGKLLADMDYWLIPWVSASLGVGFNHAYSFHNTSTIFQALPNPDFISHTETAFTYTLGVGVQTALTGNWSAGLGYEFADWGKSHLGRAAGQTMGDGLSLDHLYTNALLFNLTWAA